jgi:hypothetical protein
MAIFPRIPNPRPVVLAATMIAATLALTATPAAADAMSELLLFNFGTEADPANREAAKDTPEGPMPLLPVELAQMTNHDDDGNQTSETGAGGS